MSWYGFYNLRKLFKQPYNKSKMDHEATKKDTNRYQ